MKVEGLELTRHGMTRRVATACRAPISAARIHLMTKIFCVAAQLPAFACAR